MQPVGVALATKRNAYLHGVQGVGGSNPLSPTNFFFGILPMDYIQIFSAAGIGSIMGSLLTVCVQAWLSNQQLLSNRKFNEKKEAYVGFLQAAHINEIENTRQSATHWAYWQARCQVVGSKEVAISVQRIEETNPIGGGIHPDRPQALVELKEAMRKDLGIDA